MTGLWLYVIAPRSTPARILKLLIFRILSLLLRTTKFIIVNAIDGTI